MRLIRSRIADLKFNSKHPFVLQQHRYYWYETKMSRRPGPLRAGYYRIGTVRRVSECGNYLQLRPDDSDSNRFVTRHIKELFPDAKTQTIKA